MSACTVAIARPTLTATVQGMPKGGAKHGTDAEGRFVWLQITGPSSYDTGGSAIPLTATPFKRITHAYSVAWTNDSADPFDYSHVMPRIVPGSSPLLKLYTSSATTSWTEATAAANYSTRTWFLKVYGVGR